MTPQAASEFAQRVLRSMLVDRQCNKAQLLQFFFPDYKHFSAGQVFSLSGLSEQLLLQSDLYKSINLNFLDVVAEGARVVLLYIIEAQEKSTSKNNSNDELISNNFSKEQSADSLDSSTQDCLILSQSCFYLQANKIYLGIESSDLIDSPFAEVLMRDIKSFSGL